MTGLTVPTPETPGTASRRLSRRRTGRSLTNRLRWTFALLAGALLLIVGVVLTVVSYNTQLEQLAIRQQKTADEAVLVASNYLVRAQDMLWTYGHASSVHSLLLRSLDIQQEQLESIIAQYPDVFQELTLLDDQGKELARVSSSYLYPAQELGSWADSPAIERTTQGEAYVSSEVRVPAYAGYPTILMAVPLQQQYGRSGILAADISVKGMWDAIAGVEVGETGYAYIVNRNTGELVAHSNLNRFLALEGQSLESVPIVSRLMADRQSLPYEAESLPSRYVGLSNEPVFGAVAKFPNTPWAMIVELPVDEAMAGVRQMIVVLVVLVVLGVLVAAGLGLIVPRRLVGPLREMQRGAQALGAGNLHENIDVRTGDELQDLAESFNQMAASLRASRDELERRGVDLEARVVERTRELTEITARTERRALQLQTSADVARTIASVRDVEELLHQVVETISQRFGWYHAGIFLIEDAPSLADDGREKSPGAERSGHGPGSRGKVAVLRAASSEGGRRMIARGHRLRVGEQGIVGTVAAQGQARIALDVGQDATYFDTPELHGTRSEMALPLRAHSTALLDPTGEQPAVIGVLDVQSLKPGAYDQEDVVLLSSLADQVAIAIENARLFRQTQRMLEEVRSLHRQVVEQEWDKVVTAQGQDELVYDFRRPGILPQSDPWPPELLAALRQGEAIAVPGESAEGEGVLAPADQGGHSALAAPIKLRDRVIGGLELQDIDPDRRWTDDEIALVQSIADEVGLALENARLLADTRRRAGQLATLHRVGLDITSALDLDGVLQALYQQTSNIVDVSLFSVALYDREVDSIEYLLMMDASGPLPVPSPIYREQQGLFAETAGLAAYVIDQSLPVLVPDLLDPPPDLLSWPLLSAEQATRAYAGIPLVFREQVFGVLSVHSSRPAAYSQEDLDLLTTMTTQASIAIQNARAYGQLVDTAEQLREVDRLKTQFLANMSHELRTPLNSIIGFSRVMLKGIDGPLTSLQEADLASIYNSGQHLLGLINSILDMSKIEAGKMDLAFEQVHLPQILDTVVSTTRALIKDRPIELQVQVPPDLPALWADPQRVRQILINLLSNAAKYTENGQIVLSAEVQGPTGEWMLVSVADSGVGIDLHAQQRLFIPFQQVDASTTRRAGGTGLGLAISRSFVQMHGGEIWVESQPGRGSTFCFTLPVYDPLLGQEKAEGKVPAQEDQAPSPPDKKLVLAIDDDPGVITLFKRYLESDGYQVVGLLDSTTALEVARSLVAHPQGQRSLVAITLDVIMSRTDGWQVLDALKADPRTAGIPVILCSIAEGLDRGLSMGAAAWLQKPVTREELLTALAQVRA